MQGVGVCGAEDGGKGIGEGMGWGERKRWG